jgi:epoxyqueuosine reductase
VIDARQIKNLGQQFGIDKIRIATAEPLCDAATLIKQQIKSGLYLPNEHWHRKNIDALCDVQSILPGARSIITACQCYLTDEKTDNSTPGDPHGLIARYTWRNHYADLRERLGKIAAILQKEHGAKCRVFSNSGIAEKPVAQRCGIGFYGKHSIIVNEDFGSWIVLGEIVNTLELEPDPPSEASCGKCNACVEACPTGAIIEPYVIDRRLCIQARTNWYGVLPDHIARVWGNRLYGCSLCQDVCPANQNVTAQHPRTDTGYVGPSISLCEILGMNEGQYRRKYTNNQITAKWINFKAIQRNAIVALGNIRDRETLPLLERLAMNNDPVLAQSAGWAIKNF